MEELLIADTLDVVGKVMVAYTAIRVHYRVWKEHRIDERVFLAMHKEQLIAVIGIFFILGGYAMRVSLAY
jgi:hypothetical protein